MLTVRRNRGYILYPIITNQASFSATYKFNGYKMQGMVGVMGGGWIERLAGGECWRV